MAIKDGLLVVQEWDVQSVSYRLENHGRTGHGHDRTPGPRRIRAIRHAGAIRANEPVLSLPGECGGGQEHDLQGAAAALDLAPRGNSEPESCAARAVATAPRALDKATYDRLAVILKLYEEIGRREQEIQKNAASRQKLLEQQKTIQGNLASLRDSGEEGQLRTRYARSLAEQEDRLAGLDPPR